MVLSLPGLGTRPGYTLWFGLVRTVHPGLVGSRPIIDTVLSSYLTEATLNQWKSLVLWHSPSHTEFALTRDIVNFETVIELKHYCTIFERDLHVHAARLGLRAVSLGAVLRKFRCKLSSRNWLKDRAKLVALQPFHSSSLNRRVLK